LPEKEGWMGRKENGEREIRQPERGGARENVEERRERERERGKVD